MPNRQTAATTSIANISTVVDVSSAEETSGSPLVIMVNGLPKRPTPVALN